VSCPCQLTASQINGGVRSRVSAFRRWCESGTHDQDEMILTSVRRELMGLGSFGG
jgi:hypothetical protein